jgi:methyl-accepting chemotaxis protein
MSQMITAKTELGGDAGADALAAEFSGLDPRLICVWASTQQPLGPLLAAMQRRFPHACVVGASTAGEFTSVGDTNGHAVACALGGDFVVEAGLGTGLRENSEAAITTALSSLQQHVTGYEHRAAILLFDGLAGVGEEATLQAAMLLGDDVKVAGAAAGDDWAIKEALVGTGTSTAADAAVVCLIHSKKPLGLGVRHGHEPFTQPFTVTKSAGSVVFELDGKPAWTRYVELTRDEAMRAGHPDPATLTSPQTQLEHFSRYSAAMRTGAEWRNRTPLVKHDDGSLSFTCGIAEGTVLTVLKSDAEHQVNSARRAASEALAALNGPAAGALVFDCVCRKVLLGERFGETAQAIAEELRAPLAGFKSYGEVALQAGDFSGFHNATTVVLVFPE